MDRSSPAVHAASLNNSCPQLPVFTKYYFFVPDPKKCHHHIYQNYRDWRWDNEILLCCAYRSGWNYTLGDE